ncbi:uncharacterized protein LOC135493709 [Lineus longissimus]|uniref:uncharacterized protein LOC135493709 n=1 Tax=Lineus longissimus TaxID=88925 RepID=UPI00315DDBFF
MKLALKITTCNINLQTLGMFLFLAFHLTHGSYYNPHVYPERGPFFEGWYIRITDHTDRQSLAVLFGKVLKKAPSSTLSPALVSILHSNGTRPLTAYNAFFDEDAVEMTVDSGKPVTKNPNQRGPANFKWEAKGCGYLLVKPDSAYFNFTVQSFTFYANISSTLPWGPDGVGPEGWLSNFPLPLDWFVYNTGSNVTDFGWASRNHGQHLKGSAGRHAVAHMEKNWGKSFPSAWYWGQGVTSKGVYFAMSGGPVDFGPITVNGHLIGYRNPAMGIRLDYRPDNSFTEINMDACAGVFNITVKSLLNQLQMNIVAPVDSLSDCLYGPGENGFHRVCTESFVATANIRAYRRKLGVFGRLVEVDRQTVPSSALEFGGTFVCHQKCHRF